MTGTQKLLILARYLDTVQLKRSEFNLAGIWQSTCKTMKDPVGYATQIPELAAEGFTLLWKKDYDGVDKFLPQYMGFSGWVAITEFFDIGLLEAKNLFLLPHYPKGRTYPSDVAGKIKAFVRIREGLLTRTYLFQKKESRGQN